MKVNLPFELLFGIGILLFTFSIFIYGLIIRRLLPLINRKGIWVLPIIGVLFLLVSTVIHFYRIFFYGVELSKADPEDLFPLINGMIRVNSMEAFSILGASLLTLIGITIYYRWILK
jgi:hypothetical protein